MIPIPDDILIRAARISKYGSEVRYPQEIYTEDSDAVRALEDGEKILNWVKSYFEKPSVNIN